MSKPELPGGQSLEEILASIRKTLAEDRPEEDAAPQLVVPRVEEAPRAANGAAPVADGDTLHQRLVLGLGASNGAVEDGLSDLLAADLGAPILAPKAGSESLDRHDPPWFASRAADAPEVTEQPALNGNGLNGAIKAALNGVNGAAAKPAKTDDAGLTRPETLRRSFPPLFGDGGEVAPRPFDAPNERPAKSLEGLATVRRDDIPNLRMPKSADLPGGNSAANAQPDPTKAFNHLEARFRAMSEPAPAAAEPVVAPEPVKAPVKAPEPVAVVVAAPEAPVEQVAAPVEVPVAEAPKPAKAASAASALADQPLQEVIARLLEPVIQEWLDANLPRMVEAAIREEVTRQLKVSRGELKI